MDATRAPAKAEVHRDPDGEIIVLEGARLMFQVRRVYFVRGVAKDVVRGEHAHKVLKQILICAFGRVEVRLDDSNSVRTHSLSHPSQSLFVDAGIWRSVRFSSDDAVLVVLASEEYDADDYIHDYDKFLDWRSTKDLDCNNV